LAWWSIRNSELENSLSAPELRQAYNFYQLQASVHELQIQKVFSLLRSNGVEPLLIKGWGVSLLYPEKGLRPSGDIDICVLPEDLSAAEAVLKSPEGRPYLVDLWHQEVHEFDRTGLDQLYSRSQLVRLGDVDVRVPCPEDHLRVLAIHLLKHGVCLPRWLCDIAVALESRGPEFNWQSCFGSRRREADWVACAIGLSHCLLGADVSGVPIPAKWKQPPKWIITNVQKRWETLESMNLSHQRYGVTMAAHLSRPHGVVRALYNRWPDPIEATVRQKGSFNAMARLPYQLTNYCLRTARFVKYLFTSVPE
jgi:putative nucleotidyltransferase-like protein